MSSRPPLVEERWIRVVPAAAGGREPDPRSEAALSRRGKGMVGGGLEEGGKPFPLASNRRTTRRAGGVKP